MSKSSVVSLLLLTSAISAVVLSVVFVRMDQEEMTEMLESVLTSSLSQVVLDRMCSRMVDEVQSDTKEKVTNVSMTNYNARQALLDRRRALEKFCDHEASDFMAVDHLLATHTPASSNFLLKSKLEVLFCPVFGVGHDLWEKMFFNLNAGDEIKEEVVAKVNFGRNFPRAAADLKRFVLVRHPLERLVAAYRKHFESWLDISTGESGASEVSFPDFVSHVLRGHVDLAKFVRGHRDQLTGGERESSSIDTSHLDGLSGVSRHWNPIWRQCGLCHPHLTPHFILHTDHFEEDVAILIDHLDRHVSTERWMSKPPLQSKEEHVLRHYFAQITKREVRQLYNKFKVDHQAFGFTIDKFVQFAAQHTPRAAEDHLQHDPLEEEAM